MKCREIETEVIEMHVDERARFLAIVLNMIIINLTTSDWARILFSLSTIAVSYESYVHAIKNKK